MYTKDSDSISGNRGNIVFEGVPYKEFLYTRTNHFHSKFWKEHKKGRHKTFLICGLAVVLTALVFLILTKNTDIAVLMGATAIMPTATISIMRYKNDKNCSRTDACYYRKTKVVFAPDSIQYFYTDVRDSTGQYMGDVSPILRGYRPYYCSIIPYNAIHKVVMTNDGDTVWFEAGGSDAEMTRQMEVVKAKHFTAHSNIPLRWVTVSVVFKNNEDFMRTLKERVPANLIEIEQ